jgi:hypothetical protein
MDLTQSITCGILLPSRNMKCPTQVWDEMLKTNTSVVSRFPLSNKSFGTTVSHHTEVEPFCID